MTAIATLWICPSKFAKKPPSNIQRFREGMGCISNNTLKRMAVASMNSDMFIRRLFDYPRQAAETCFLDLISPTCGI